MLGDALRYLIGLNISKQLGLIGFIDLRMFNMRNPRRWGSWSARSSIFWCVIGITIAVCIRAFAYNIISSLQFSTAVYGSLIFPLNEQIKSDSRVAECSNSKCFAKRIRELLSQRSCTPGVDFNSNTKLGIDLGNTDESRLVYTLRSGDAYEFHLISELLRSRMICLELLNESTREAVVTKIDNLYGR